jgi:hypothetical protein
LVGTRAGASGNSSGRGRSERHQLQYISAIAPAGIEISMTGAVSAVCDNATDRRTYTARDMLGITLRSCLFDGAAPSKAGAP